MQQYHGLGSDEFCQNEAVFTMTVTLDGFDDFVERIAPGAGDDRAERDRVLAETNPSMAHLWYGGEAFGRLWLRNDSEAMEVTMLGPTVVLDQMLRARDAAARGESFDLVHHGGYGVEMRVDVNKRHVRASRTPSWNGHTLNHLDTFVSDFVSAVDRYEVWYHTEYLTRASWLLQVEDVQQYRIDAGYTPDRT